MNRFWARLAGVRHTTFDVTGDQGPRHGEGRVVVHTPDPHTVEWIEEGRSFGADGRALPYHDRIRWRRDEVGGAFSLHHLRQGETHPVHLGDLRETANGLEQLAPHHCGEDLYQVKVALHEETLLVEWTVTGPKKSYTLIRWYR